MDIINWIWNNSTEILLAITSLVTAASIIVRMTPSVKDDEAVGKVMKWVEWVALNKDRLKK